MKTYRVIVPELLPAVVRLLRLNGARAWQETVCGSEVLCTDASRTLIGICCGSGVWITSEHGGLPDFETRDDAKFLNSQCALT